MKAMGSMAPGDDNPLGGPFDDARPPAGGAAGSDPAGGGFLDDLRDSGEEAVNTELQGLQAAMSRVESFTQAVAGGEVGDVDDLRSEWAQIESEIKRALQHGLSAVEERGIQRQQASLDSEVQALASDVARKNELIAQLSDSVKKLNSELDEKERRLRDESRGLRERLGQAEDELLSLRSRVGDAEGAKSRLEQALDVATSDVEELRRQALHAGEALAAEKSQQEERFAALNHELNEAHLANSKLEAERREAERKMADAERRLAASDKAREKSESERNTLAQESSRNQKDARIAQERVAALESELSTLKDRLEKDLRKVRRREGRLRADAETFRSRIADVVQALQGASGLLAALPKDLPPDDDAPDEQPPAP